MTSNPDAALIATYEEYRRLSAPQTAHTIEQGAASAAPTFDPAAWLGTFAAAGGGYALGSDRRLSFSFDPVSSNRSALASALTTITVEPANMEAVRRVIEAQQGVEVLP